MKPNKDGGVDKTQTGTKKSCRRLLTEKHHMIFNNEAQPNLGAITDGNHEPDALW